jgi:tape measure domain-containing protein
VADKNFVLQLLITAKDQASAALGKVGASVQAMGGAVSQALAPLRTFGGLLAAAAGIGGAKELLDRADAYTRLTNQLRVATTGEEQYQAALEAVVAIARRSNADLDSTAGLYGKISQSAKALGLNQTQVADVTELVAKAMQLSGADAQTASGAILQLGQALASGTLRGDEFNSIMEASPKLMDALAAGLGVAVGELRAMAEAGQLTADRVVKALLSQKAALDETYGKLPQTVGQAMTGLANAGTLFVGKLDEQTGATQGLVSGLKFLAENLDAVAALMGAAFAASLAKGTVAFGQQVAAMLAAKEAARELAVAAAAQQQEAVAAAQGHLAAAQAAANRALAEQRLKLQIVAAMEAELGYGAVTANLTAARQQASAAATAATAATQRYATAQTALVAAQGTTTASVGLFSRALGVLTGPVGLIVLAVSALVGLYEAFSKQKPVTDALATSLDEYSAALGRATTAQLAVQALDLETQISAQKKTLADVTREWEIHKSWLDNAAESGRDVAATQEDLTRTGAALETETQKLNALTERRNLLLQEQKDRTTTTVAADAALVGQYNQQATAMDQLSASIQARAKHLKTVSDAQIEETEALLAKAEAEGQVVEIDRLTVQLAAQRATAARLAAQLAQGEATAATVKVAALEAIERVQNRLTPQEAAALQAARAAAAAKTAEARAAEALAAQLEALAGQQSAEEVAARRTIAASQEVLSERQRNTEAARGQIGVVEAAVTAARDEAQRTLELAEAKGDELTARQAITEVARLEAALAALSARRKGIEAEAAIAVLIAVQDEIEAKLKLGEIIGAEEEARLRAATVAMETAAIEAQAAGRVADAEANKAAAINLSGLRQGEATGGIEKHSQAVADNTGWVSQNEEAINLTGKALNLQTGEQQKNNEAKQDGNSITKDMNKYLDAAREATSKLSVETGVLFEKIFTGQQLGEVNVYSSALHAYYLQLGDVKDAYSDINAKLAEFTAAAKIADDAILFSTGSVGRFYGHVAKAYAESSKAYYEQKLQAEQLKTTIADMADGSRGKLASVNAEISALNRASTYTIDSFNLLNEQDLSDLRASIDAARAKILEMQAATVSARERLAEMNAELLEAKGEDKKAELLRQQISYMSDLKTIRDQITEAEQTGNRELLNILTEQERTLEAINRAKVRNIETDEDASDSTSRSTTSMNGYADAAERAVKASASLAKVDLSGLHGQLTGLTSTTSQLSGML